MRRLRIMRACVWILAIISLISLITTIPLFPFASSLRSLSWYYSDVNDGDQLQIYRSSSVINGNDVGESSSLINGKYKPRDDPVLILAWTFIFGRRWTWFLGRVFEGCPSELNCVLTYDQTAINKASAVLFHMRDTVWSRLPPNSTRRLDQYYVFADWESPQYTWRDLSKRYDYFNLTMTYRLDSDVFIPYGEFCKRSNSSGRSIADEKLQETISGKTKLIAWVASNCNAPSGRKELVEELTRYVPVDIYGKCGDRRLGCEYKRIAPSTGLHRGIICHQLLTNTYKFYLSFENSLCRDYVTEKFYSILKHSIIVPVVMERKIIHDTVHDKETAEALDQAFIAVDDFGTIQELADYLEYLDRNTSAYLAYFQWRSNIEIVFDKPACELCRIVKERGRRVITNISEWWNDQSQCHRYKYGNSTSTSSST